MFQILVLTIYYWLDKGHALMHFKVYWKYIPYMYPCAYPVNSHRVDLLSAYHTTAIFILDDTTLTIFIHSDNNFWIFSIKHLLYIFYIIYIWRIVRVPNK